MLTVVHNHSVRDVGKSSAVAHSDEMSDYAGYFANTVHLGDQICIAHNWALIDQLNNVWHDAQGKPVEGGGPFTTSVAVLDLIKPSIKAFEDAT